MLLFSANSSKVHSDWSIYFFMGNRSLDPDIVEKHTNNPIKCISTITDLKQDFDMKSVSSFGKEKEI